MKQRILLCAFTLSALSTFAQDSTFQLKDYQYRTPGFQALSFDVQLGGVLDNWKIESHSKNNNRNFSFSVNQLHYFRTISTDKRLHTSFINVSPSFSASSSAIEGKTSKAHYVQTPVSWHRSDKFYKAGKWFLELGNNFDGNVFISRANDTTTRTRHNNFILQNTVVLGFGKGRIENVQDAQMAMYILAGLEEQGLLNAPVAPQTVREFARLITSINNRRVFDSRRRRIFELTQIDAFLRSKSLVKEDGIRYFTTVNDNWALAYNPGRLSGANWYVRLQPGLRLNNSRYHLDATALKQESKINNTHFFVAPMAGYEKYVPVNLQWQRNMGASLSYEKGWYNSDANYNFNNQVFEQDSSEGIAQFNLHTFYGVGYYPNNRTQVTANIELDASRLLYEKGKYLNVTQLKPALRFSADYFISYQTRLYAQYYLSYQHNFYPGGPLHPLDKHQLITSVSVGLSHILF